MPKGTYKRSRPIRDRLDNIKEMILKDTLDRSRSLTELAKSYGVSKDSLAFYYRESNLKKCRKSRIGCKRGKYKSRIEDLRVYIKENNITKLEVMKAVLTLFKK